MGVSIFNKDRNPNKNKNNFFEKKNSSELFKDEKCSSSSKNNSPKLFNNKKRSKNNSIIKTTSLDTCIGIIIFDRKKEVGTIEHCFFSTIKGNIGSIINEFVKANYKEGEHIEIEYQIVLGRRIDTGYKYYDPNILYVELVDIFESYCDERGIEYKKLNDLDVRLDPHNNSYEIAFNVNTGQSVTNKVFGDDGKYYR